MQGALALLRLLADPRVAAIVAALIPVIRELVKLLPKEEAKEVATTAVRKEVVKVKEERTSDPFPPNFRPPNG